MLLVLVLAQRDGLGDLLRADAQLGDGPAELVGLRRDDRARLQRFRIVIAITAPFEPA